MNQPKTLLCPFCGSDKLNLSSKKSSDCRYRGTVRESFHTATMRCNQCHARGPTVSAWLPSSQHNAREVLHDEAVEAWNTRVKGGNLK